MTTPQTTPTSPTVVAVHGAFTDASSFGTIAVELAGHGIPARSVAIPLRGLATDAAYVGSVLAAIEGPVVLVGHSYSGSVITEAAAGAPNVKALVYVAAFLPEAGESSADLNGRFPGSMLTPDNLMSIPTPDGLTDLYIKPERYEEVYAGGLSREAVTAAAFAQRPITAEALGGTVTRVPAAGIPRWEIVATRDNAVPTQLQRFMAERAGARVLEADCGHDVQAARPQTVLAAILEAVQAVAPPPPARTVGSRLR